MSNNLKHVFSYEDIKLEYSKISNSYAITTPTRHWIAIPAENLEDVQIILKAAIDHRDFGTVVEHY